MLPRKDKDAYTDYMRRYMRKYREFQKWQKNGLERAVRQGNIDLAREILNTEPSINLLGLPKKKPKQKRR